MYADFFYKFRISLVTELYKNREDTLESIEKLSNKKNISEKEILMLNDMEHTLEILVDLTEARMGLEH